MRRSLTVILLAAIAFAAILAGILTIGGPVDARAARLDERKAIWIERIAHALRCNHGQAASEVLPESVEPSVLAAFCDPHAYVTLITAHVTIDQIRYYRDTDTSFRICADFTDAANIPPRLRSRIKDGCISGELRAR